MLLKRPDFPESDVNTDSDDDANSDVNTDPTIAEVYNTIEMFVLGFEKRAICSYAELIILNRLTDLASKKGI